MARKIYDDLSAMSDCDTGKFSAYKALEASLDRMEMMVNDIHRHALVQDPSGIANECQVAKHLEKKVEHVVEVIQELIGARRKSSDHLRKVASLGCLVYELA